MVSRAIRPEHQVACREAYPVRRERAEASGRSRLTEEEKEEKEKGEKGEGRPGPAWRGDAGPRPQRSGAGVGGEVRPRTGLFVRGPGR